MEFEFSRIGVKVISFETVNWVDNLLNEYDLLLGLHWPVYGAALYLSPLKFRFTILLSLSHFVPVESLSVGVECADLILFGTAFNAETQLATMLADKQFDFLPNSLPEEWFLRVSSLPHKQRLAIVSNHPPPELLEAQILLSDAGLDVRHIGISANAELVDSDLTDSFTAFVTIGLTVQKAMSRGRGVFLYDHFGGVGWLSPHDAASLDQDNFSCRGKGTHWSAEKIACDILAGLASMTAPNLEYRNIAEKRYSLESHLGRILKRLPNKEFLPIAPTRSRQSAAVMIELMKSEFPNRSHSAAVFLDARYNFSRRLSFVYLEDVRTIYKDMVLDETINIYPGGSPLRITGNAVFENDATFNSIMVERSDGEHFAATANQPSPWLKERFGTDARFANALFVINVPLEHDTLWLRLYSLYKDEVIPLFQIVVSE